MSETVPPAVPHAAEAIIRELAMLGIKVERKSKPATWRTVVGDCGHFNPARFAVTFITRVRTLVSRSRGAPIAKLWSKENNQ